MKQKRDGFAVSFLSEQNMRNEAENKKNGGDFRDVKNDKPEIKSEKGMEQNRSK